MSKSTPKVRPLMQKIRETNEIPLELLDRNKKFRKNFCHVFCVFSVLLLFLFGMLNTIF